MNLILFSTDCPKCKILEQKLTKGGFSFTKSNDLQEVIDLGFMYAPILKVDDTYMNFTEANTWVKNNGKE